MPEGNDADEPGGSDHGNHAIDPTPTLTTAGRQNVTSPLAVGHEYVWHCHILEHEEHDMMRPMVVT